eukprot:2367889-Prymnesium_polylepis.1
MQLAILSRLDDLGAIVACTDGTTHSTLPDAPPGFALDSARGAVCALQLQWRSDGPIELLRNVTAPPDAPAVPLPSPEPLWATPGAHDQIPSNTVDQAMVASRGAAPSDPQLFSRLPSVPPLSPVSALPAFLS